MLVISRKVDQVIEIGPDVRVVVIAIGCGKVRLGIEAPRDVRVHRGEIAELIRREEEQSEATD